ncbi:hypothetical protein TrVGV298_007128 [Trichoderma virens]|nr:hypothetical protein TrVGV298_007128 [Trichoderma virens]
MDEECIESSEPIFELASECEKLFSEKISRLKDEADLNGTKVVGEYQQRFSAWAAFLGVFAVPEMCLDRRLQRHAEVQDLVLRLLDIMKRNLTHQNASDGEKSEAPSTDEDSSPQSQLHISIESLRGIEGAIERLHHLGGTIQLSSEASQATKFGKFAAKFDSASFEEVARLAIRSFYPDASPSLIEHLARTMTDIQEFKKLFPQRKDGSVKSKTRSIAANLVAYPQPSEASLVCDWCFSPLPEDEFKAEKWKKHLNEDFKPYLCLSEKCSEPLKRFATSTAWFSHMLEAHGQNWHREVHLPTWWICPLCNNQETTYPKAQDLSEHISKLHRDVFTEQQIQVIVHQSRLRAPRPQDVCPLCCLSMKDEQEKDENDQSRQHQVRKFQPSKAKVH